MLKLMLLLICCYCFTAVLSFTSAVSCSTKRLSSALLLKSNDNDNVNSDNRRALTFGSLLTTSTILSKSTTPAANALGGKSRTQGYDTQHTEKEWSDQLSPDQYFILRNGGTEAPYSSILEGEERDGTYVCAGCSTPLFDASQKFHSGTGWPSYAKPIGNNIEMENISQIQYKLAGAEVRCSKCGGHLGDVFADGFLFPGTAAFVTGQRYCIDGAALVFQPKDGGGDEVRGDLPPKNGGKPVFYG